MRRFLRDEDARDEWGNLVMACLVAAAVLVAIRTLDPLVDTIRQIIQTQIE